jgi:hypothetical protein
MHYLERAKNIFQKKDKAEPLLGSKKPYWLAIGALIIFIAAVVATSPDMPLLDINQL